MNDPNLIPNVGRGQVHGRIAISAAGMRQREFIRLLGAAAMLPVAARAEHNATGGRIAKIGIL
jgi:hypothetical protein